MEPSEDAYEKVMERHLAHVKNYENNYRKTNDANKNNTGNYKRNHFTTSGNDKQNKNKSELSSQVRKPLKR